MAPPVDLQPDSDVDWTDGRWLARSGLPWLAIPALTRWRGRWIRLRYACGLFDEVVRPLIRFTHADGAQTILPMNGALTGVGEWIGPIPRDTVAVALCPARSPGPFSFRVERVRGISRARLVLRGLAREPRLALMALGARLIGARAEARHCLKFASLGTPLADYGRWLAGLNRAIDLAGFDRPHADWSRTPLVHVIVAPDGDDAAVARTIASLDAQSYPRWRLDGDEGCPPDDLLIHLDAGDMLHPHGLGLLVDRLATGAKAVACYGDDDSAGEAGLPAAPRLKPDFSPGFAASASYIGRAMLVRASHARSAGELPDGPVLHVRRPVLRRGAPAAAVPPYVPPAPILCAPPAAIIVPTRDRPELLAECLATLRMLDYPEIEVVLVDNGTTDARACALLDQAAADRRFSVLRAPGPFNYAALCNAGAAAAAAPLLVFLNNDVVATGSDWLRLLATRAMAPGIGAVGPKLLFPDGRVQHGGDVVGLGETAQHAYRLARDGPGDLGQLDHGREVAAVTGAVQVVERRKFDAVGGFDAAHFPVLLNDTDLCLRLAARGWASFYEPAVVMVHKESASRGHSPRAIALHARERRNFTARWLETIRHDPYFHPALSLYAWEPRLG